VFEVLFEVPKLTSVSRDAKPKGTASTSRTAFPALHFRAENTLSLDEGAAPLFVIMLAGREKDLRNAERSLRDTRKYFDKTIDEIRAELQGIEPEIAERVGRSLNDLKNGLQSGIDDINGRFEDEIESGRKQVREHPLLAVGVAVMAGVIVGTLLGKNKD
jgi:hypothetical protein